MVTFTCARCKSEVDRLWEVQLVSTELKVGEHPTREAWDAADDILTAVAGAIRERK